MSKRDLQGTVTLEELVVSSLATADALTKLLIEKRTYHDDWRLNLNSNCCRKSRRDLAFIQRAGLGFCLRKSHLP